MDRSRVSSAPCLSLPIPNATGIGAQILPATAPVALLPPWQDGRKLALLSRLHNEICMENRTEPKTARQWIRYIVVAAIAIWLVIWMLRISGINIL